MVEYVILYYGEISRFWRKFALFDPIGAPVPFRIIAPVGVYL